jgi:hypothetical protein
MIVLMICGDTNASGARKRTCSEIKCLPQVLSQRCNNPICSTAMHQVASLLKGWPRASPAIGFGIAATAYCALLWGQRIFPAKDGFLFALFIGVPGVSAAVAGWILGEPLLDETRSSSVRAALRGAAIGSVALLIFAPLFAIIYVWAEPATEHANILGLTVALIIGGALAVWWQIALIGAAVGWGLHRLASYYV